MAVFLVPDTRGRSLCLLTAADLAHAQAWAALYLGTSDSASITGPLTTQQQADEGEWCRMTPMTAA